MRRYSSIVFPLAAILVVALWLVWQSGSSRPGGYEISEAALPDHATSILSPIAKALDTFKFDVGRYPTTAEGLAALFAAPGGTVVWRGPYLESSIEEFADPWGRPYVYRCPAVFSNAGYDLWSSGPDGRDDGGARGSDDVVNWR